MTAAAPSTAPGRPPAAVRRCAAPVRAAARRRGDPYAPLAPRLPPARLPGARRAGCTGAGCGTSSAASRARSTACDGAARAARSSCSPGPAADVRADRAVRPAGVPAAAHRRGPPARVARRPPSARAATAVDRVP